jgi:hypothetical protein
LIAGLSLLGIPLVIMRVIPDAAIGFLTHEHVKLAGGIVPINNYHLLLFTWSTTIGIILYTEFLTWYLSRKKDRTE